MATKKRTYNNNPQRVLLGLVIGGLAGVVTMLLFAPQSGKQTRDQIEEKAIELREQTTKNLKKRSQDKLVEQLERVSAALETGKTAVEAV
jgi:gas vesicle protein